jgi:hypothetical protein
MPLQSHRLGGGGGALMHCLSNGATSSVCVILHMATMNANATLSGSTNN